MVSALVVSVFCTCVLLIAAHQHSEKGKDGDDDTGDDGRCRCASYCQPDEYHAGVCTVSWWRRFHCCAYRTCQPCRCTVAWCTQQEVHKGYCVDHRRKCCPRCKRGENGE